MQPGSTWLVVGWIALHLFAFATAFGTRVAAGTYVETLAQICFFAAMAAIGAATWIGQQFEVAWTWSAITLMAMVLTAVIDFRRAGEPAYASVGRY
jgi:hypothetical protein